MSQAPNDPVARTYPNLTPVSQQTHAISGLTTHVFGLDELPEDVTSISVLWLLHPRLSKKEQMAPIAHATITAWNQKLSTLKAPEKRQGLIAVAFDQRNHGERIVSRQANQAWAQGNPKHAQDMWGVYRGTAADVSLLIDLLPAYVFPESSRRMTSNFVLGVSLGAHAAWHCVLHDERISTAVIVVGCADYTSLMKQRAAASKLASWTKSNPAGKDFVGSSDFPAALQQDVDTYDPAALLMGEMLQTSPDNVMRAPSEKERKRLWPIMRDHVAGKRICLLSGAGDKLVPYECSRTFLEWLKRAVGSGGWFEGMGTEVEDQVFDGVGHEFSRSMAESATTFLIRGLEGAGRSSKI